MQIGCYCPFFQSLIYKFSNKCVKNIQFASNGNQFCTNYASTPWGTPLQLNYTLCLHHSHKVHGVFFYNWTTLGVCISFAMYTAYSSIVKYSSTFEQHSVSVSHSQCTWHTPLQYNYIRSLHHSHNVHDVLPYSWTTLGVCIIVTTYMTYSSTVQIHLVL